MKRLFFRASLLAKNYFQKLRAGLLRLKNVRKGSKLSRIGRILAQKASQYRLAAASAFALIGLSLNLMAPVFSFSVGPNNQDEVTFQVLAIEPEEISVLTQSALQFPLENFTLTQGYSRFHQAIDLAAPLGTTMKPVSAGEVLLVSFNRFGLGNYLVIRHSPTFYSVYAHLSKIEVEKGEKVEKETIIGRVGSTGFSTGPHLHLEIILNEEKINPLSVLPVSEEKW